MPFDFQIKKGVREGWEPLVVRLVMPVADALRLLKTHFITVVRSRTSFKTMILLGMLFGCHLKTPTNVLLTDLSREPGRPTPRAFVSSVSPSKDSGVDTAIPVPTQWSSMRTFISMPSLFKTTSYPY